MPQQKGFSLIEVLISLVLIISTAIALLNQQWQLSQWLNQILIHSQHLVEADNRYEAQFSSSP